MVKTVTTARCNAPECGWQPEGDPDRSAARHTKASKHPTVVVTEPAR